MSLQAFLLSLLRWPDGVVVKVGNELQTSPGGGGGGSLAGLSDVVLSSPTDGQVLTYDAATSKWTNAAPPGGGGGGVFVAFNPVGPLVIDTDTLPSTQPLGWRLVNYVP